MIQASHIDIPTIRLHKSDVVESIRQLFYWDRVSQEFLGTEHQVLLFCFMEHQEISAYSGGWSGVLGLVMAHYQAINTIMWHKEWNELEMRHVYCSAKHFKDQVTQFDRRCNGKTISGILRIFSPENCKQSLASIGVARGGRGAMPPKYLENIVILCFERRFSKQNNVIRLKSNIYPPWNFWAGYATARECKDEEPRQDLEKARELQSQSTCCDHMGWLRECKIDATYTASNFKQRAADEKMSQP